MKYSVYLLVLANVALAAWMFTQREQFAPKVEPGVHAIPFANESLTLLSERSVNADESANANPDPEVPQSPSETLPETRNETPSTGAAADAADTASPTMVVPEATSEESEQQVLAGEAPAPESMEEVAPPKPVRVCQSIGPFRSRAAVDAFKASLADLGISADLRTSQIEEPADYWVFLPEMPRAEARATVKDLEAKGVKDYFHGRQNFISLGVFSDQRTAKARVQQIQKLGYEPKMEPRYRARDVFWVDTDETGPDLTTEETWQELLGAEPGIRRQPVTCE